MWKKSNKSEFRKNVAKSRENSEKDGQNILKTDKK